jgi:hypothetical protein
MCLVVDTCSFPVVFHHKAERFLPIQKWIFKGKGKLIYGGTTFAKEIRGKRTADLLAQLKKAGKAVQLPMADVDAMEREIKAKEPAKDFNDPHLLAMIVVSKCCVVCTDEKKAVPYLKRRDLYPEGAKLPKIYRNKKHADLCCDDHLVKVCK